MVSMGAAGAFTVSAASYIPFILVALWILPAANTNPADVGHFDRRELLSVLRKVAGDPMLRGGLLTVLVTSTLGAPLVTFAPVFVRQSFQGNIGHFSLAIGALGVGGDCWAPSAF